MLNFGPRFVHATKDVQSQMLKDPAVARVWHLGRLFGTSD